MAITREKIAAKDVLTDKTAKEFNKNVSSLLSSIGSFTKESMKFTANISKNATSPITGVGKSILHEFAPDKSKLIASGLGAINPMLGYLAEKTIESNKEAMKQSVSNISSITGKYMSSQFRSMKNQLINTGNRKQAASSTIINNISQNSKPRKRNHRLQHTTYNRSYGSNDITESIDLLRLSNAEWLQAVGAGQTSNKRLPRAESGGIVKSTGQAIVHEGETITPKNIIHKQIKTQISILNVLKKGTLKVKVVEDPYSGLNMSSSKQVSSVKNIHSIYSKIAENQKILTNQLSNLVSSNSGSAKGKTYDQMGLSRKLFGAFKDPYSVESTGSYQSRMVSSLERMSAYFGANAAYGGIGKNIGFIERFDLTLNKLLRTHPVFRYMYGRFKDLSVISSKIMKWGTFLAGGFTFKKFGGMKSEVRGKTIQERTASATELTYIWVKKLFGFQKTEGKKDKKKWSIMGSMFKTSKKIKPDQIGIGIYNKLTHKKEVKAKKDNLRYNIKRYLTADTTTKAGRKSKEEWRKKTGLDGDALESMSKQTSLLKGLYNITKKRNFQGTVEDREERILRKLELEEFRKKHGRDKGIMGLIGSAMGPLGALFTTAGSGIMSFITAPLIAMPLVIGGLVGAFKEGSKKDSTKLSIGKSALAHAIGGIMKVPQGIAKMGIWFYESFTGKKIAKKHWIRRFAEWDVIGSITNALNYIFREDDSIFSGLGIIGDDFISAMTGTDKDGNPVSLNDAMGDLLIHTLHYIIKAAGDIFIKIPWRVGRITAKKLGITDAIDKAVVKSYMSIQDKYLSMIKNITEVFTGSHTKLSIQERIYSWLRSSLPKPILRKLYSEEEIKKYDLIIDKKNSRKTALSKRGLSISADTIKEFREKHPKIEQGFRTRKIDTSKLTDLEIENIIKRDQLDRIYKATDKVTSDKSVIQNKYILKRSGAMGSKRRGNMNKDTVYYNLSGVDKNTSNLHYGYKNVLAAMSSKKDYNKVIRDDLKEILMMFRKDTSTIYDEKLFKYLYLTLDLNKYNIKPSKYLKNAEILYDIYSSVMSKDSNDTKKTFERYADKGIFTNSQMSKLYSLSSKLMEHDIDSKISKSNAITNWWNRGYIANRRSTAKYFKHEAYMADLHDPNQIYGIRSKAINTKVDEKRIKTEEKESKELDKLLDEALKAQANYNQQAFNKSEQANVITDNSNNTINVINDQMAQTARSLVMIG